MNTVRLRYVLRERDVRECQGETVLSVYRDLGVVPKGERDDNFNKTPEDLSNYKLVLPGDVVVNKMKAWQGSVAVSAFRGIVSGDYLVCAVTAKVDRPYIHHLLRSHTLIGEYAARAKGVRPQQWRLYWEDLADIRVMIPSLSQQARIGRFLDAKTARIDSLIDKKRRMIDLLWEKFSIASERLVLGVDSERDEVSRTGWFRSVPSGWTETQLRHSNCEVQTGPFGSQLHAVDYVEGGWPIVNPANLTGGRISRVPGMEVSDETRAALARHILQPGDIVFGRRGQIGRAGLVESQHAGWLCGTGSLRLRLRGTRLQPHFLKLLLETRALRSYFELQSVGSTMENINSEMALSAPVLVPPIEKQVRVVASVRELRIRCDEITERLTRQIALLRERRQSLINAVLINQSIVPGSAA